MRLGDLLGADVDSLFLFSISLEVWRGRLVSSSILIIGGGMRRYHVYEDVGDFKYQRMFGKGSFKNLAVARCKLMELARRNIGIRKFLIWEDMKPILHFFMEGRDWWERNFPQVKPEHREQDLAIVDRRRRKGIRVGFQKGDLTGWIRRGPINRKK